jgi:phosphate transport system substrate-binding protein
MTRILGLLVVLGIAARLEAQQVQTDPRIPAYEPRRAALAGEYNVIGAVALKAPMELWTEAFSRLYPNVRFHLTQKGSSTAAAPLVTGISQLAPMGRQMWECELIQFQISWGYLPTNLRVSRGSYNVPHKSQALAIYVNKDNPIEKLTLTQIDAIFSRTRNRGFKEDIATWGELGVGGAWANQPIKRYGFGRPKGSEPKLGSEMAGVAEWFRSEVLLNGAWHDKTITEQSTPQDMVRRLSEDRYGIGFAGISYLMPDIKIVGLAEDEGRPYSKGSLADVLAGKYPLTRLMYVYLNKAPGKPLDPTLREFLTFVLSREGQELAAKGGEALPLPLAVVMEERSRLEKFD